MDLSLTCLALSDGVQIALIVDIDIQILTNDVADRLRQTVSAATGVPFANIRASASHTHSGPTPYKSWITQGFDLVAPWLESVAANAAEAARDAIGALQPVVVRAGRGECRINTNRRAAAPNGRVILGKNPDGFCDREVLVVKLDTTGGESVATIVNYACHPTIMGPANRLITPDYPGIVRRDVEAAVGGKCLFLLGAAGDQGPAQGFQADVSVYHKLGAILGHEAAKIALSLNHIPASTRLREIIESGGSLGFYDDEFPLLPALPLKILETEIAVPLRTDIPVIGTAREQAADAHAQLQLARDTGDDAAVRAAIVKARRADLKLRLAEDFQGRSDVGVSTHILCFGDSALVACNIEPFAEIGAAVKHASPFPFTLVSGYTNGRLAYMPTPGEWARGGHEVVNSPFAQNAGDVFVRETVEILRSLRAQSSHAA